MSAAPPTHPRKPNPLARAAAGLFYAVLFVLALEACARVDDALSYGAPLLENAYTLDRLMLEDEGGIRGRPGGSFEKWRLNSLGFRGPEVPLERTAGVPRVLVLGASETFGVYETPGKEYPARLREILSAETGGPVEVLNGSLVGMSLPRAAQYCRAHLRRLAPDLVVYYPTPAAYLDNDPPRLPSGGSRKKRAPRPTPRLARRVQNLAKSFLPPAAQDALRRRELERATRGRSPGWVFRELPEDRLRLFERDLGELAGVVRGAGVPLVLGTHAHRFVEPVSEREREYLTFWRKFYPRAEEEVILRMERRANEAIRGHAGDGVRVADVAREVPPQPANFHDFSHFSDQGADLAARAFARAVLPLLPRPGSTQSPLLTATSASLR